MSKPARRAAAALLFLLLTALATAAGQPWRAAQADYPWSFPADHWARAGYQTEWWYFTGHLNGADGRRFGYQFTFFRVGLLAAPPQLDSRWAAKDLIMGHAAISDLGQKRHYFAEVLYRAAPPLGGFGTFPDTLLAWSRGPAGTAAPWTLRFNGSAFDFSMADQKQGLAFKLSTQAVKPLIFQGPDGYSRKGAGPSAASQYYSFTRLATAGTLQVAGQSFAVEGTSWMDKEFGSNQLGQHQSGWDWFSLQLDDGRDIMLYLLRDLDGHIDYARATLVASDSSTRYLDRDGFALSAAQTWTSPHTGATYPAGWSLRLADGETLQITPAMADQENRCALVHSLFYWEGAVTVTTADGRPAGQGYVELTGYGTARRPGI